MGKSYIEMRYRQKKYKLNADDIGKLYKISKRKIPSLPRFEDRTKILLETDDDTENVSCVNAWGITIIHDFNIFLFFSI